MALMQALDTFLFEDLHAWNVYSSSRAGCSCTLGSRLELSQVACQLFTQCDLHVHDQHDTCDRCRGIYTTLL